MEYASSVPTAEEIASLTDAFRRDPSSDAFVRLGEGLIALGRPREAIDVGARGLKANPTNVAGRLMVARAFASLHQWKEAQAELLKLVKIDRNHPAGFALLGEVLLRRADYERALPVLQHAQNLSPANPQVLALVRRARAGQPLDPPPPIPTPQALPPASPGAASLPAAARQRADSSFDDMPTHVAPGGADAALGRVDLVQRQVARDGPSAPAERASDRVRSDARGQDGGDRRPVEHHAPPAAEDPLAPLGASGSPPPVRPRVLPAAKPKDAAQASLRQSAAVGEQYLNELLTAGLLEVPNVRVSQQRYDVTPDKTWGRSAKRLFLYLFVLLFAGVGGGGFWYWYAANQQRLDVDRHLALARELVGSGDYADLGQASSEARAALARDKDDAFTMAVLAEVTALSSLLYGEYDPAEVQRAIDAVADDVASPDAEGHRELVIARAALTLATLPGTEDAESRLAQVRDDLGAWREGAPEDRLAAWLLGRAHLAAGAREAAEAAFEEAHAGGDGTALAAIELGHLRLDEGAFDEAVALYDAALEASPSHPLAFVGRSLARSERRSDPGEAMADLNVGLAEAKGARLVAWKQLALSFAQYVLQDFEGMSEALDEAAGVAEPRFLARVGLARMLQGRIVDAAQARQDITWFASDPEPHPLVALLDAELLLARGLPDQALGVVEGRSDLRAESVRGRALFELGRAKDALAAFERALAIAPDAEDVRPWAEAARMMATRGRERDQADETLDRLGRQAKSKAVRYVHGVALTAIDRRSVARDKLEQSLDGITDEYPNPLAYRSHVALAELDLAEGKVDAARGHLEEALASNPGFLPARDLMGQALATSDPEKARGFLVDVIEAGVASAGAELAFVTATMPSRDAAAREAAVAAIRRAKEKGAATEALQQAVLRVDDSLFDELAIQEPR